MSVGILVPMSEMDPRVSRTRAVVKAAAQQVLLEWGPDSVNHQRVAEVAGVGRATLYRHWPRPDDLLYLAVSPPPDMVRPIGDESFRDYLVAWVIRMAESMSQPLTTVIFITMLQRSLHDERARTMRTEINASMVHELRRAIRLAKSRGEHSGSLSADLLGERLVGPVMYRTLMLGRPIDPARARQLVDSVLTSQP